MDGSVVGSDEGSVEVCVEGMVEVRVSLLTVEASRQCRVMSVICIVYPGLQSSQFMA